MEHMVQLQENPQQWVVNSVLIASRARISSISVFSDHVWDRREYAEARPNSNNSRINWQPMFVRYGGTHYPLLISVMECAYALLFDPVDGDNQLDTQTVKHQVRCLASFLEYLQTRHLYETSDLEHADMHDYLRWLLEQRKGAKHKAEDSEQAALKWAAVRVSAVQTYYRYRTRVSQPLPIDPFHGKGVFTHLGKKRDKNDENATPVIPKSVWDPYLCAALDYVEIYAPDILEGQAVIECIRTQVLPLYIDQPQFEASNFRRDKVEPVLRKSKRKFAINPRTGNPWRTNWFSSNEFFGEMRALYHACLVVIGCLSGMRESELALMEVDGFWRENAHDGTFDRYRIASRVTKGDVDKADNWEVNEPVFRACNVLKELTAYARAHVHYKELFIQAWDISPTLQFNPVVQTDKNGNKYGKASILPVGTGAFRRYLRGFARHLTEALGGQYRLPLVDGDPWVFNTRMLRRSLAGRIAREPFGMIAGMLHYKHVKITTFEGYAGSDPNWVQELQEQEIAANEEFLEEIWEDLQDGALAGAKGEELVRDFKGVAGELKTNALQYFIESNRANLHMGLLNYCIFQKDRALCLMEKKQPVSDMPALNSCHPDRCANSCISKKHLPQWQVQVDDARAMLGHKKVTEPQRIALSRDLEKAVRIVNQLKDAA